MRGKMRRKRLSVTLCEAAGEHDNRQQQPRGAVFFDGGDEGCDGPDKQRCDKGNTQ